MSSLEQRWTSKMLYQSKIRKQLQIIQLFKERRRNRKRKENQPCRFQESKHLPMACPVTLLLYISNKLTKWPKKNWVLVLERLSFHHSIPQASYFHNTSRFLESSSIELIYWNKPMKTKDHGREAGIKLIKSWMFCLRHVISLTSQEIKPLQKWWPRPNIVISPQGS